MVENKSKGVKKRPLSNKEKQSNFTASLEGRGLAKAPYAPIVLIGDKEACREAMKKAAKKFVLKAKKVD